MDESISLRDHTFQLEAIERLTELRTGQESIVDHLKRLNGSVSTHDRTLAEVTSYMASHQATCPLGERVEALEGAQNVSAAVAATSEKVSEKWQKRVKPWLMLGAGAAGALVGRLVLLHGPDLITK